MEALSGARGVLCSKLGHGSHDVGTTVLSKGAGNDFECASKSLEGPLHAALNVLRVLGKSAGEFHLDGTTTGNELGVEHNVTCNTKSVVKVALNFVEDILRGSSEDDRASLGCLALSHEGEILVSDFLNLEEAAVSADIGILELLGSVGNSGTRDTGNSVVVGLTDTSDDSAVSVFHEEVLSSVRDSLLGDDNIRLDSEDVFAHLADFLLFHVKCLLEIVFLCELHVGH